jgi:hypothetical protein
MGKWRQAVELAMTDEEMEALTAISRSRSIEQIFCPSPIVDTDFISDWWTAAQIRFVRCAEGASCRLLAHRDFASRIYVRNATESGQTGTDVNDPSAT